MKRLTLLTILLVVVGLTAGALEVKPAFTLSGAGTLEWGVDLMTMATGFRNTATADLTVTLMAVDGTDTHAGTGDWYGSITISNVELGFASDELLPAYITGGALGVAAKIVGLGGKLAIGVVGAPSLAVDFVGAIENADVTDTVVDVETDLGVDYVGQGTYVSYALSEALMVGFDIVSNNAWTVDDSDAYAMALDVVAKFAPLTITAGVNYGFLPFAGGGVLGMGVQVAADTKAVDAYVGFDASLNGGFAYEVGAGVTFTFMETVTAAFSLVYDDPLFDNLDLKFVLTEPAAKGLVDNLDASLTVYLLDIGGVAGLEYEGIFTAGYLVGKLYPHFGATYGDANNALPFCTVYVHVDYTLFDAAKTVLSLGWNSGDLLLDPADMGELVAGVTITY
jgi:hypothetical protein